MHTRRSRQVYKHRFSLSHSLPPRFRPCQRLTSARALATASPRGGSTPSSDRHLQFCRREWLGLLNTRSRLFLLLLMVMIDRAGLRLEQRIARKFAEAKARTRSSGGNVTTTTTSGGTPNRIQVARAAKSTLGRSLSRRALGGTHLLVASLVGLPCVGEGESP